MSCIDMRKGTLVAITRGAGESAVFAARLKKLGARVLAMPTIEVRRRKLTPAGIAALTRLERYGLVLFTSAHAARFFAQELRARRLRMPSAGPRIAAVGPSTAKAVRASRLGPCIVTRRFTARDLVNSLGEVRGTRILFPRSAIAPSDAVRDLRKLGARVLVIPLYDTVPVKVSETMRTALLHAADAYVVFASPSAIRGLLNSVRREERRAVLRVAAVCIGPRTAAAARRAGFRRVLVANTFTLDGLVTILRALP